MSIGTAIPDTRIIPPMAHVGKRLRIARKLRGLTQEELAKGSGVTQASISEVETGESKAPSGTNLVRLAQTLKVSPDWLATGKGSMDPTDQPLPPEAVRHARQWLRLAPEVREKVADMVDELVRSNDPRDPNPEERPDKGRSKH